MTFFFKVVTWSFRVSPSVIPQVLVTRTTRSNSNRNVTHFISRKCNTVTFQRSFFNRTTRIWNTLANDLQLSCNLQISQFKSIMYKYYVDALERNYDPENPRSWKTICPSCNRLHVTCLSVSVVVFNCLMLVWLFLTYLLSSGTTVIGSPLLWHPCLLSIYLFHCLLTGEANKIRKWKNNKLLRCAVHFKVARMLKLPSKLFWDIYSKTLPTF